MDYNNKDIYTIIVSTLVEGSKDQETHKTYEQCRLITNTEDFVIFQEKIVALDGKDYHWNSEQVSERLHTRFTRYIDPSEKLKQQMMSDWGMKNSAVAYDNYNSTANIGDVFDQLIYKGYHK